MEPAQCFRALGFDEMPASRETVEAAYAAKKKEGGAESATGASETVFGATESGKLAARLLEENYRACLHRLAEG